MIPLRSVAKVSAAIFPVSMIHSTARLSLPRSKGDRSLQMR